MCCGDQPITDADLGRADGGIQWLGVDTAHLLGRCGAQARLQTAIPFRFHTHYFCFECFAGLGRAQRLRPDLPLFACTFRVRDALGTVVRGKHVPGSASHHLERFIKGSEPFSAFLSTGDRTENMYTPI